ncbi:MAG TPA: hypothetical protein VFZ06_04710 [Acidimicrobiia bacterium]|nr:hypothetical protein [Acidimicrobiia bacterium]
MLISFMSCLHFPWFFGMMMWDSKGPVIADAIDWRLGSSDDGHLRRMEDVVRVAKAGDPRSVVA